jgi:hypothetical protein
MFPTLQDCIAMMITMAACVWLIRSLTNRFFAPPCQPPRDSNGPTGSDGFVSVDKIFFTARSDQHETKKPG